MALAFTVLAKTVSAAPHQDATPPRQPTPFRIGDDACAVVLEVRANVIDAAKRPVEGAKVWFRYRQEAKPHWGTVGLTDGKGQLVQRFCYQGTSEYHEAPPKGKVELIFVVSTWRYKDHEVRRLVDATTLLHKGLWFSEVRPRLVLRPGLKPDAAFPVKLKVVLRDVA